ncbi:alpha/beta fold hydrolase [Rossellomorea aquimaris]|uniref:S9 family peptidase n=1 Tax=Rossellomorea aquimaris TaxID=189382 RepID=UPI001CD5CE8D|nr:alpha/beta fold hydrolase [Rossellomorea aquimaris]MCA1055754.1 alpha/beta fold hydrolase [Rossellomorea aquimaris]
MNEQYNLWVMDLPHTYPYPLTSINQNSSMIHIHEATESIIATFEHDGDEQYQLYHLPLSGGHPVPFNEKENESTCYHAVFTADHQEMYYASNHENPLLNIYKTNLETNETHLMQQGDKAPIVVAAVSPDGSAYTFTETYSNTHAAAYYHEKGDKVSLVPDPSIPHVVKDITFAGNDTLYLVTNYQSEFSYIASFSLSTYEFQPLIQLEDEEINAIKLHNGTIFFPSQKGVRDHLYHYDLSTKALNNLDAPCDIIKKIQVTNKGTLYILGVSAHQIDTIFKRDPLGEWSKLTNHKVLGISDDMMIKPEVVHYNSFDGLSIEALLFKPQARNANGYSILWPHGGPQSAERLKYRPILQYLAQSGYVIFAPNFRGSTGYGSSFQKMVEQNWGEGPRLDCVAGMDWLISEGHAEKGKLFSMGGSYGGYMSLLLAGRHSEYFSGIVDIFGISNLLTFIENVPPSWRTLMNQMVGDPEKDREKLVSESPITYLDGMDKPMFIIHGQNDPRVKTEESERIVNSLKGKGVRVEYLLFDDEGHGFSKKKNEMEANKRIKAFLDSLVK